AFAGLPVWQPREGWLRVDPPAAVAPQRHQRIRNLAPPRGLVGQALANVNPELLLAMRRAWERMDQRWNQWVLGYSRSQQLDLLKKMGVELPDLTDLSRALVGLLVSAALAGAAWAAWDRRRRSPWERTQAFVARRLQRLNVLCPAHEGPRAWAQRVQAQLGPAGAELTTALLALDRLRYGPEAEASGHVPKAWRHRFLQAWQQAQRHQPSAQRASAAIRSPS
ncbi:MAG: DUF3488 domain-containing protein, partial [Rubrivivax sp.]